MKKLLVLTALLFMLIISYSQEKQSDKIPETKSKSIEFTSKDSSSFARKNFLDFINNIDWNSKESDLIKKYNLILEPRERQYLKDGKTETTIDIKDISLNGYNFSAKFVIDSISRQLVELLLLDSNNKNKDPKKFIIEMDQFFSGLFGQPDIEENSESEYINDYQRQWFKDKYDIKVWSCILPNKDKGQLYSLTVKKEKASKEIDFRVAKWGDSKAAVMQKEGKDDNAKIDRLYLFPDFIAGYKCDVAYIFTNDKLTMCKYIFNLHHTNMNEYIQDFKSIVTLLIEKYGKPDYNSTEWKNSLYRNDPDEYGFAISLGHLTYNVGWFKNETDIKIALYGENYKNTLIIQYKSKKYDGMKDKKELSQKLNGL